MISTESKGLVLVRLFPDEDFLGGLQEACREHGIKTGVVVGAVGMLRQVDLRYFQGKGKYSSRVFDEAMELVTLSGIISRHGSGFFAHLHGGFGRSDKSMAGGHLHAAVVAVTAEVALLAADVDVERREEEATGLLGLFFSRKEC
jgi:predicted DNA-binding protein with PD1-like motif